jgi:2-phospho-L-lactate guanylyltransferase
VDQFSVLIPMKIPSEGKSRLAEVLDGPGRKALIISLLERVLEASMNSSSGDVYVIGGGFEVADICRQNGANWLASDSGDLNLDVSAGIAEITQVGNGTIYLPGDLPFVTSEDIDLVINRSEKGDLAVLVASESDGGTNCVLFPYQTKLIPLLGSDSYRKHCKYAVNHGILFESLRPAGLLIDLDTAEDLKKCQRREKGFLGNVGIN